MRVWLMRHGIAVERGDPECPPRDEDRPLTEKGRRRVATAAKGLLRIGARDALLICSPLRRAIETADIVARILKSETPPRRTNALVPEADPKRIWEELRRERAAAIMCFGHLPHLDDALEVAIGAPRARVASFKKAGVAVIDFDTRIPESGVLAGVFPPSVLRMLGSAGKRRS